MPRRNREYHYPTVEHSTLEKKTVLPVKSFQFWIIFFFHLLLLTVPLFFTWVNEELFEFNKIILVYGFTVIIASLWVGRMIVQKKLIWKRTVFDFPIAFFLLSQLLSTIFSINFHTSIFGYYTRFNGGLLSTISYITLFYAFINNIERKHLPRILFSTFLSALAVSLWAIPEHFGHSFSCVLIDMNRGATPSWATFDTSCWIQDVQSRVFATFGQPNWLAAYAIILIPLGALLSSGKIENEVGFKVPSWQKFFYLVTTFALFLTLIFTKSRSGFLGLGVGLAFGGVALLIRYVLQKTHPAPTPPSTKSLSGFSKLSIIIQMILVIFAVAVYGTPYTPTISDLLMKRSAVPTATAAPTDSTVNRLDEGGTDSGEIRRIVWTGAIKVWERYPIFGSGVETFAYSYYRDRPQAHNLVSEWDFLYNKAHNEFLNYLATTGLVGLLTYLLFLGATVFVPILPASQLEFLYRKKLSSLNIKQMISHDQDTLFLFGTCLSSGVVALSVSNFFGFSTVVVSALLFLWPAIWIVFGSIPEKETAQTRSMESENPLTMNQIIFICLLFFVSLALVFHVYGMWQADYIFAKGKQNSEANQVNVGLPLLEQAVENSPGESYYYEELAVTDARIAAALQGSNNATEAAQFKERSLDLSQQMIEMNPVNLNFYKSQARIYSLLTVFDLKYAQSAIEILQKARTLAPTDPKLLFNISVLELNSGDTEKGLRDLKSAIELKPNYIQARLNLAEYHMSINQLDQAKSELDYIIKNINDVDPQTLNDLAQIASMSAKTATQKK
ncbi:hypothetical protein BH10PAT2_BH10PAT2_0960 [soil metagenome]